MQRSPHLMFTLRYAYSGSFCKRCIYTSYYLRFVCVLLPVLPIWVFFIFFAKLDVEWNILCSWLSKLKVDRINVIFSTNWIWQKIGNTVFYAKRANIAFFLIAKLEKRVVLVAWVITNHGINFFKFFFLKQKKCKKLVFFLFYSSSNTDWLCP